ncbi:MAG: hypothetical protein P8008_04680 [Gammaproteobacteria bacterium]
MNSETHDREMLRAVQSLPRSLPPRRDLWPEIRARLAEREVAPEPRRRSRWPALAASVAVAFAVGLLMGRSWTGPVSPPGPLPAQRDVSAASVADPTLAAAVEAADREYQAAFLGLVPVGAAPAALGDDAALAIEGSWEDLRDAETALLAALKEFPDNPYLNQKLIDLRARQLAFLRELQMLDEGHGRST